GGWWPTATIWFNHSAWLWMDLMLRVSEWAAHMPGGCFYIRAPSALTFALYYGVLVSVSAGWWMRPRVLVWLASALGGLLAVAAGLWQRERTTTRLSVLPLHGGMAVYSDALSRSNNLLMDCGNEASARSVTKPFLQAQGVNQLPGLLLTHGDTR